MQSRLFLRPDPAQAACGGSREGRFRLLLSTEELQLQQRKEELFHGFLQLPSPGCFPPWASSSGPGSSPAAQQHPTDPGRQFSGPAERVRGDFAGLVERFWFQYPTRSVSSSSPVTVDDLGDASPLLVPPPRESGAKQLSVQTLWLENVLRQLEFFHPVLPHDESCPEGGEGRGAPRPPPPPCRCPAGSHGRLPRPPSILGVERSRGLRLRRSWA